MLRTILVALAGSALAEPALPLAADIARRSGGSVHLVRAHVPIAGGGATAQGAIFSQEMLAADDARRRRAQAYVDSTATRLVAEWGLRVTGEPTRCLLDHVKETDPDGIAIAIATQGRGVSRILVGSIGDKLIPSAGRPVLVVRPPKG